MIWNFTPGISFSNLGKAFFIKSFTAIIFGKYFKLPINKIFLLFLEKEYFLFIFCIDKLI